MDDPPPPEPAPAVLPVFPVPPDFLTALQHDINAVVALNWRPPSGSHLLAEHLHLLATVLDRLNTLDQPLRPLPQLDHIMDSFPLDFTPETTCTFFARLPLANCPMDPNYPTCDRTPVPLTAHPSDARPPSDIPVKLLKSTAQRCETGTHVYKPSRECGPHPFRSVHLFYLGYPAEPTTAQRAEKWKNKLVAGTCVHFSFNYGYALFDVGPVEGPADGGEEPGEGRRKPARVQKGSRGGRAARGTCGTWLPSTSAPLPGALSAPAAVPPTTTAPRLRLHSPATSPRQPEVKRTRHTSSRLSRNSSAPTPVPYGTTASLNPQPPTATSAKQDKEDLHSLLLDSLNHYPALATTTSPFLTPPTDSPAHSHQGPSFHGLAPSLDFTQTPLPDLSVMQTPLQTETLSDLLLCDGADAADFLLITSDPLAAPPGSAPLRGYNPSGHTSTSLLGAALPAHAPPAAPLLQPPSHPTATAGAAASPRLNWHPSGRTTALTPTLRPQRSSTLPIPPPTARDYPTSFVPFLPPPCGPTLHNPPSPARSPSPPDDDTLPGLDSLEEPPLATSSPLPWLTGASPSPSPRLSGLTPTPTPTSLSLHLPAGSPTLRTSVPPPPPSNSPLAITPSHPSYPYPQVPALTPPAPIPPQDALTPPAPTPPQDALSPLATTFSSSLNLSDAPFSFSLPGTPLGTTPDPLAAAAAYHPGDIAHSLPPPPYPRSVAHSWGFPGSPGQPQWPTPPPSSQSIDPDDL